MKVNLSKSGWGIILGIFFQVSQLSSALIVVINKIFARKVVEVKIIIIFIDKAAEVPAGEHRTQ